MKMQYPSLPTLAPQLTPLQQLKGQSSPLVQGMRHTSRVPASPRNESVTEVHS